MPRLSSAAASTRQSAGTPNTSAPGSRSSAGTTTRSIGSVPRRARTVSVRVVIDLIHVLEYRRKAAWCFHAEGDPAAAAWVRHHASAVLDGKSTRVAGAIRRAATIALERDCAGDEAGQPAALPEREHRRQPDARHQIRVIEGRRQLPSDMRNSRPSRCPSVRDESDLRKPHSPCTAGHSCVTTAATDNHHGGFGLRRAARRGRAPCRS
jgi:hypothetical protein